MAFEITASRQAAIPVAQDCESSLDEDMLEASRQSRNRRVISPLTSDHRRVNVADGPDASDVLGSASHALKLQRGVAVWRRTVVESDAGKKVQGLYVEMMAKLAASTLAGSSHASMRLNTSLPELKRQKIDWTIIDGDISTTTTTRDASPQEHVRTPAMAIQLLTYLHEVVVCESIQAAWAAFQAVQEIARTLEAPHRNQTRHQLCMFLLPRVPHLIEYLTAAVELVTSPKPPGPKAACEPWATKVLVTVWTVTSRILMSPISLDARICFADEPRLPCAFACAALQSEVYQLRPGLSPASTDYEQLAMVIDTFALSPFWSTVTELPELNENLVNALKNMTSTLSKPPPGKEGFYDQYLAIKLLVNLMAACQKLVSIIGEDVQVVNDSVTIVCNFANRPNSDWAMANMEWLLFSSGSMEPEQAAALTGNDASTPVEVSLVPHCASLCFVLLNLLAHSSQGASSLHERRLEIIQAMRSLIEKAGAQNLKNLGVWYLVETLVTPVMMGNAVPDSGVGGSMSFPRRFRRYNMLLRCSRCSRLGIGSRSLKICGECYLVRYCGEECQHRDWLAIHHHYCMKTASASASIGTGMSQNATEQFA